MTLRRALQGMVALSVVGLGIALYLAWVYLAGGTPVCNGSGGCAAVQTSPYAWVGPIPVPVLGVVAYLALIVVGVLAMRRTALQPTLLLAGFGIALIGVLFSAYLTYLELFVIHAICQWCVGSAVVMTLVFVLAAVAQARAGGESAE